MTAVTSPAVESSLRLKSTTTDSLRVLVAPDLSGREVKSVSGLGGGDEDGGEV